MCKFCDSNFGCNNVNKIDVAANHITANEDPLYDAFKIFLYITMY